jgi:phosphate transport system permease protein
MSTVETALDTASLRAGRHGSRGDAVFRALVLCAGALVFVLLGAIAVFLVVKAIPSIRADKTSFWTTQVFTAQAGNVTFGIAAVLFGTVVSSALALLMAVPVGVSVAIYITQYAPRRIATLLGYITDLLAAVPSVVYGLWGVIFLVPRLVGPQSFLAHYFHWIPIFSDPNGLTAYPQKSIFAASVVLAIMILPIVAAISREVLRQVDPSQKEAALALGATRWEMVRTAVLPPSRAGIISAAMLGLGRALGETLAVALVIGTTYQISGHLLLAGGVTIASNIATLFGESDATGVSALIASGLVLFVLTLAVNLAARYIILRSGTEERSSV